MGLVQRIRDLVTPRRSSRATQEMTNGITVNALCSAYENLFAQLRPLIDEMKTVQPYGVGRNGGSLPLTRTPELAALQDPNDEMGWGEFMDAAFATWLTESELNIHVHRNGRGKVYGYSILPPGCRQVRAGGEVVFQFYSNNEGMITLTRDEVATLRFSRSPRNLDKGVSPASSVFTWSQIDDLMAQYQKAYLENGAIPASITIIRASTRDRFEEAKKQYEKDMSGAKNRNKTLFIWRQFDNDTGAEKDAIEVKTIQGNNSTLAIKELFEIVNDRLNKAVGVSNFILGDDSSAKYDNAELSDRQFTKRRVYPALMSFWGQFQHELDRITGGLGYAISFDLEIPELTEQAKVAAEKAKIETEKYKIAAETAKVEAETLEKHTSTLTALIKNGASPADAVAALGLDKTWLNVANGISSSVLSATTSQQDKNQIIRNSINPTLQKVDSTKTKSPITPSDSTTTDAVAATSLFAETEVSERHIYEEMMKIVDALANEYNVPTDEVIDAIMQVLTGEADSGANAGAKNIAGIVTDTAITEEILKVLEEDGFHVDERFVSDMKTRVSDLVERFEGDTKTKMEEILSNGREEGLSASQLRTRLRQILPDEMSYRAEVIARNETTHAFRSGRLSNDEFIASTYDLRLGKVWKIVGDTACELCKAMDGQVVALSEPFPAHVHGKTEDGEDVDYNFEHTSWNNDGCTPDAHTNCRCYFNEVVINE